MPAEKADTFYYFTYGTYVDPEVLKEALAAVTGTTPVILSAHPALLPGYRLVCDAVSVEGPRLGRLNVTPYSLVHRSPPSATQRQQQQRGAHPSDAPQHLLTAFRDGVRGILYELPAELRPSLLQAVAREGSFNMYASLTCYEVSDVRHGVKEPDARIHEAIVIAALDLPLLEQKFFVEAPLKLRWMSLPVPEGVAAVPGLSSVVPTSKSLQGHHRGNAADLPTQASGLHRWPGLHWCNCVNSVRVAPSLAYAAVIEKAYCEHLLLQTAAEAGAEAAKGSTASQTPSDATKVRDKGDCISYGQAVYRLVYARARDVPQDPQERKTWYLAYGSNLSWEQVCVRIGPPYQRRAVKLPHYVLVPNTVATSHEKYATLGYFNVEPVTARQEKEVKGLLKYPSPMPDYVCGAAYEISQAQLELMDLYERGYDRELHRCTDLRDASASAIDCWTYIARNTSEDVLPSKEYLSRVLEGADILPMEYMEYIRATPTNPLRSPRQDKRLRKEV